MEKLVAWLGVSSLALALGGCAASPSGAASVESPSAVEVAPQRARDPRVAEPLPDDPLDVTVHALSNGMLVYISTDETSAKVDAHVVVRAGARQEPEHATELAHYLEHMMFKGTDRLGTTDWAAERPHLEAIEQLYAQLAEVKDDEEHRRIETAIDAQTQAAAKYVAPNEIWSLLTALGASDINARTGNEVTVYDVWGLPSNRLAAWAEIEAERFRAPAFRLFFPELEAVYEERNIHADQAGWRRAEAVARVAWGAHPNARVSNPRAEHLRTPAFGAMKDFFEDWYTPSNLAVVLVGDVAPDEALPVLERTLGALPDRRAPRKARRPLDGTAAGRVETVAGEQPELTLVWTTAAVDHEDAPALLLLDDLVMSAENGLLVEMFYRTHRVDDTWSSLDLRPEGGYWQLHGDVREGQNHAEVQAELLALVQRLRTGDFSAQTLDAVKLQNEVRRKRGLEDLDARTEEILASMLDGFTWREAVALRRARARVTKEEVVAVANKYLDPDAVGKVATVRGTPPRDHLEPPAITPLELDTTARSPMAKELLARQYPSVQPVFARRGEQYTESREGGARYVAVLNERNDLFDVSYRFEQGTADDPLLCVALEALADASTPTHSMTARHDALARLGARAWVDCEERTAQIRFRGLDRNFEETARLVRDWITAPRIESSSLAARVDSLIGERQAATRDPDDLAGALWEHILRGEESSYQRVATNAELRGLTAKDTQERIATLMTTPHHVLYYGPRSAEDAYATIDIGPHRGLGPEREPTPQRLHAPTRPLVAVVDAETAKAEVYITWVGGVRMDDGSALAYLADDYYSGGMSGLLLQELREARALVYSAGASTMVELRPGDDSGLFVSLSTAPGKAADAVAATLELVSRPVEEERHASARAAMTERMRRRRLRPRSLPSKVAGWHAGGMSSDPGQTRWRALTSSETDAAAFDAFRAKLVAPAPAITIVGDVEAMDLEALRELGEVRLVEASSLFGYE